MARTAIEPTREEDYPEWYQQVIKGADMAEHSPVRGCMVIKPWGYAIWEFIQKELDAQFKATGHQNAYFPLFIPLSSLQKEANHIEGFATECAIVTHHRLEKNKEGKLVPAGELEEPLIVRPTSEMIIGEMFAKWIESYRDLPLKINQWANVVRWEMRTRLFLRTAEFLWQEGHTAHATSEEAYAHARLMHRIYIDVLKNLLAIPVIAGEKTESERFPGAVATLTFEAMMQDGKALQGGTSHFLGQSFSKAQDIMFTDKEGEKKHVWTTSWGATTRLIGALIMVHGDDDGLVLPPKVAPIQVILIPIIHKEETREMILQGARDIAATLVRKGFRAEVDERDMRAGDKSWAWIKKGVPLRIEVGQREMEEGRFGIKERHKAHKEKVETTLHDIPAKVEFLLASMHEALFEKALNFQKTHIHLIDTVEEFYTFFNEGKGFALCHWSGDPLVEERVKKELNVTIRVIPDEKSEPGICPFTGRPSPQRVIFAKSY
ncbi:MAG: proline--tRNA ligase [Simkaniaceae bacterium]|nr:proline--tRNA ligase [Simkaniaceae bacterium]